MQSLISRHPMLRSVLALALVAAFGACGGGDGPLDPSESTAESPAGSPASSPVATEGLAALITTQRIAFVSSGPLSSVWKMDPLGTQVAPLFTQASGASSPAWSWDNTQVAMVRPRVSNGVTRTDILVMNADGTNQHWARSQASVWHFGDPTWAPGGSRIVMTVLAGSVPTLGWIEPATSKAGLLWFPGGGGVLGTRASFNKAGTRILYVGPHHNTIEQINPDGSGHQVRLTANTPLDYPSFSPDGTRILYVRAALNGNGDIYVKNLTTGVTTRLTSSSASDSHPSWSPDGTRIAFMSERSGKRQVYTMQAATGGDLLRLTKDDYYTGDEPAFTH
jgi:Periplasmic component of the Tol biopolymer transport system